MEIIGGLIGGLAGVAMRANQSLPPGVLQQLEGRQRSSDLKRIACGQRALATTSKASLAPALARKAKLARDATELRAALRASKQRSEQQLRADKSIKEVHRGHDPAAIRQRQQAENRRLRALTRDIEGDLRSQLWLSPKN